MRTKQLLQAYGDNAFLRGWSREDLARLERTSTIVSFHRGEVVSYDTSTGREFLVLLDGTATLTKPAGELAHLVPGDHLGELAILGGPHERSTVLAETGGKALVLSEQEFVSLLQTTPSFGRRLTENLARHVA